MRIAFTTLGCKVNQFETQALELCATARGHEVVLFSENADAYVINTCSVTAVSDKKSRQLIRKTSRANEDAIIAVCGCFAQTKPKEAKALPGVSVVSGTADKEGFLDMIESAFRDRVDLSNVDEALRRREFEILPAGGLSGHTRAMLKVQDGCVNFCSYCIIPYARGPVRSMPFDKAVDEAKRLRNEGYHEIVITGIEISSYGVDFSTKSNICTLICAICEAVPEVRIRLGSLEPRTIDEDFCKAVCKHENLCPQFHLSLQSGCDATLSRMRRKYNTARYYESVSLLRKYFVNPAITTDLIVGFPDESEEEFGQTLAFIKKCGFSMMHIFPYSMREGTPAASMPNQVPKAEKESRAARAAEVAKTMQNEYLTEQVGRVLSVLFEEEVGGLWQGHANNYTIVRAKSDGNLKNKVCNVSIIETQDDFLVGEIQDF